MIGTIFVKFSQLVPVMGKILYNLICNQNQNHDTKKDLKSKSKSCSKMYLKSKYNHQGFHKSKIQNTSYYQQYDTIDGNTNISKLWQSACCPNVLNEYTDCLILMPNYI